ncbi:MAG: choice-of-anchor tandem repeat NxxGxxAF-containing protein [Phycisphaerales bacterium JB037]
MARLTGPGVDSGNDDALITDTSVIGREGVTGFSDTPPGFSSGVSYRSFPNFLITDSSSGVFNAFVQGPGITGDVNDSGIWELRGSFTPSLRIKAGDPAPDIPGSFVLRSPSVIAASPFGYLASGGISDGTNALWRTDGNGLPFELLARTGTQAPGVDPGLTFTSLAGRGFTDTGASYFSGRLAGSGVTAANDFGLWSDRSGSGAQVLVREGDPAPGTFPGVSLNLIEDRFAISALDEIAFVSSLAGFGVTATNNSAVFSEGEGGGGSLRLIARTGNEAPDLGPGVVFTSFSSVSITFNGETAFQALVSGPGISEANNAGIWRSTVFSPLQLVLREGDQAPGTGPGVVFAQGFPDFTVVSGGDYLVSARLSGPGVNSTNDRGIWLTDGSGTSVDLPKFALVARTGDAFNVSDDPMSPDLRTIQSLRVFTSSNDGTGLGSAAIPFQNSVVFSATFTDGSGGVFRATVSPEAPCPADLTGSSDPNDPSYAMPDGDADGDDFFFYLDAFATTDLAVCDLTGSSDPNDPSFDTPDGDCDGDDFFRYLDLFAAGCN